MKILKPTSLNLTGQMELKGTVPWTSGRSCPPQNARVKILITLTPPRRLSPLLSKDWGRKPPPHQAYYTQQQHHNCTCHLTIHNNNQQNCYYTSKSPGDEMWPCGHIQILQISQIIGSHTTTYPTGRGQTKETTHSWKWPPNTNTQESFSCSWQINHVRKTKIKHNKCITAHLSGVLSVRASSCERPQKHSYITTNNTTAIEHRHVWHFSNHSS